MNINHMKEASSYETEESLSRVFDTFDQLELGHSESDFGEEKPECWNKEGSTGDIELEKFDRIIDWFKERRIEEGCPENIYHSYICKQREQMKLEDNVQICLTKSAILLRRGIKSQKEDEAMVLKIG